MADQRFNLTNFLDIYKHAEEETKTIVFELQIGKGRFLFMSFFADEDESTKDRIFLYLKNTKAFLIVKMYGNHSKGDFYIYLNSSLKNKIIKELQLNEGSGTFNFTGFMQQLNERIPKKISSELKVKLMRENIDIVKRTGAIDEAEKIYLLSITRVPEGKKPRDKTLRKLYMYTENDPNEIELFIKLLKKVNYTTAWSTEKPFKNVNIQYWINKFS